MEKDYTLKVWNTLTECYEAVMVTKELYDEYNRSHWKIKRNEMINRCGKWIGH